MMSVMTKTWKYQLVSGPNPGTFVSAGSPRIRVAAPIR